MADSSVKENDVVSTRRASHDLPSELSDDGESLSIETKVADKALQLALDGEKIVLTDEETKRLVRKVDLYIMPMICSIYFLQYLDKISVSYGSVLGMLTDTHITTTQYSWVATIFFAGQLVFEFPAVYIIQRLPVARFTAVTVILWGGVLACIAASKNFTGLMLTRTFLGMCEAAVVPAWVTITSQWYTKEEQGFRVGIWFSMCGFAQIFGGCMAYGISRHVGGDVNASLAGWQIVFVVTGCITMVMGIILFFALPDSPVSAWFLTPHERRYHIEHIRQNQQGVGNDVFKIEQVKEALRDPNTWFYVFWVFAANIPNSLATSFGGLILTGMGFTKQRSLLLVTPLGGVEVVALIGGTYLGKKLNQRMLVCALIHIPPIIGGFFMVFGGEKVGLAGYYLQGAVPIGWTTILGLMSSNVAGSTKKTTVNAINVIGYCAGNIISPQTFRAKDAPRYLPAKIGLLILMFLCVGDILLMRWWAIRENKKRDAQRQEYIEGHTEKENHEFLDLTDLQNKQFRYTI